VARLITDEVFHGASGVLTLVASYYSTLDFRAVGRGYAARSSADQLCQLEQSLEPVTTAIAEMTTAEWVKEARRVEREVTRGGGSVQSTEAIPERYPS
jgi:hypothetical protein